MNLGVLDMGTLSGIRMPVGQSVASWLPAAPVVSAPVTMTPPSVQPATVAANPYPPYPMWPVSVGQVPLFGRIKQIKPSSSDIELMQAAEPILKRLDAAAGRADRRDAMATKLKRLLQQSPLPTVGGHSLATIAGAAPEPNSEWLQKWAAGPTGYSPSLSQKDVTTLAKLLPIVSVLEGEKQIPYTSLTNQLYRQLYPRERGVIIYGGSFKGNDASNIMGTARSFAKGLADHGYFVVTGGGPAVMEALAQGAIDGGSHSVGCNLWRFRSGDLSSGNMSVHREMNMHHGAVSRMSGKGGYEDRGTYTVVFPGGIGTMREFWHRLEDLVYGVSPYPSQPRIAVVDVYQPFTDQIKRIMKEMVDEGRAKPIIHDLVTFVKSPEEAVSLFQRDDIPHSKGRKLDRTLV